MTVSKFNVINPVVSTKKPFYNALKNIFYIPVNNKYRFFVEATNINDLGDTEYYILLSSVKFDDNCRLCHTDNYGRCQVKPKGEMKDFIERECTERGNIIVKYEGSEEEYDIFKLV